MAFLKYDYPSDFLESTTNSLLVAINVAILDVCNKCCEINTVLLTHESFQVLPWNNDTAIKYIYACD